MDLKEILEEILAMGPDEESETIGRIMRKANKGILEEYGGIIQELYKSMYDLNELNFLKLRHEELMEELKELKNEDVDDILDNYY